MRRLLATLALSCLMALPAHGQTLLQLRAGAYDSDAQALFNQIAGNGCTAPTVAWKAAASTLIRRAKAAGYWGLYSRHYEFDAADACTARIDWANPSFSLTANGTCGFVAFQGYTGNGTDCSLQDVNQTAFTTCVQNSCGFMVWERTNTNPGAIVIGSPATPRLRLGISATAQVNLQVTSSTVLSPGAGSGGLGANADDRISSTEVITVLNGIQKADSTGNNSSALTAQPVLLFSNGGTFNGGIQLSGWTLSSQMTVPQRLAECQLEAAFHIATGAISVSPC